MATIAEQLTQLNAVKQNFKTKFTEKGVSVTGVPFTNYPNLIDEVGGDGDIVSLGQYAAPSSGSATFSHTVSLDDAYKISKIVLSGIIRGNASDYNVTISSGNTTLCSGSFTKDTTYDTTNCAIPPVEMTVTAGEEVSELTITYTGSGNIFEVYTVLNMLVGVDDESSSNEASWVTKTGALAVLPESFTTTQAAGDNGGKAGSEIFKFDSPIRNFSGHIVIKGSGGDATYRQFGMNIEYYLDSTCSQSNMISSGSQHTNETSETTFNFSLGDDIEVYGIKYTIWSADASNNTSNVGTTTCTEAMITSWEELVGGSSGTYIPAGIEAIYNTSWEALAGAGNSPYTSEVFDSGNNNKKGAYICIRNALEAIVYGSNDQSDWQPIISGNTGGSNDGETGTPKNLVSEEVDYRYFKATCTGYNNGHPTTVSWGVFEVSGSGSVEGDSDVNKHINISTVTASSGNASLKFIVTENGAVVSEETHSFTEMNVTPITIADSIQVDYSLSNNMQFTVKAVKPVKYNGNSFFEGDPVVVWSYTTTINYDIEVVGSGNGTITTKTQQVSQTSNTLYGGETQTLTFTFSELSQVLGITEISGGVEFAWLQSISINGNVVTAVVGNKRSSGGAGGKTTLKLTAIGTGSDTGSSTPEYTLKTGNLVKMTSSGAPSPFTTTYSVNGGTNNGNSYLAFDGDTSTSFEAQYPNSADLYVQLNFGKAIKLKTLTYNMTASGQSTYSNYIQGIKADGSTVSLKSNSTLSGTLSVTDTNEFTGIRFGCTGRTDLIFRFIELQITEWYEQE